MAGFLGRLFRGGKPAPPIESPKPPRTASAPCPHCGALITPAPQRSRKCPSCTAQVLVRTKDGKKLVLTEEQAKAVDTEREKRASRNAAFRFAQNIGVSEAEFAREEATLLKKDRRYSPRDVFWSLANSRILTEAKKGNHRGLSNIYWQQARLLFEEGRDHFHLLQEAARHELLGLKQMNPTLIRYVTILADDCPECKKFQKKKYSIDEALKQMPIPVKSCTHGLDEGEKGRRSGWCCCMYSSSRT